MGAIWVGDFQLSAYALPETRHEPRLPRKVNADLSGGCYLYPVIPNCLSFVSVYRPVLDKIGPVTV